MSRSITIHCLSHALSPITHQLGTVGNESVVNSEPVRTPLGVRNVPVISGNALRHRLVRSPSADYLVDALDLDGQLTKDQLNLLYHGGLRREAGNRVSLAKTADMERLFPSLRLLGCCLPDGIYSGALQADRALLVCRENADRLRQILPDGWMEGVGRMAPAATFVRRWQYVRGNLRTSTPHRMPSDWEALDADENGKKTDTMPFAGTWVIAGSEWVHGFRLHHVDDKAIGCLLDALLRWREAGATVGGQGARGHGRLDLSIYCPEIDQTACIEAYRAHVAENVDAMREFLGTLFAPPKTRKKAAAK